MFAVVLGCVLCNLSTAAYLSERKRVHTGTLLNSSPGKATVHRGQGKGKKVQAGQNQHMPGCKVYFLEVVFKCDNNVKSYLRCCI